MFCKNPLRSRCAVAMACVVGFVSAAVCRAAPPAATQPAYMPVTIHVKNVPVARALEELEKITGLSFDCESGAEDPHLDAMVTLDLEKQPLWSALVPICEAANLRPVRFATDKPGLILGNRQGAWNGKYTVIHGGFAVGLVRVEQSLEKNYAEPSNTLPHFFDLTVCVCPEPNLHVQRIGSVRLTNVLDEAGFPVPETRQSEPPPVLPVVQGLSIRTDSLTKLSLVEGEFTAAFENGRKHIEVADIQKARNSEQKVGGAELNIRALDRNGRMYSLQVIVLRDTMDDEELAKVVSGVQASRPEFLDAAGRPARMQFVGAMTRAVPAGTQVTFNYFPVQGAEPAKLSWDVPTGTSEVVVPFSFKDVPLPGSPGAAALLAKKPTTLPALTKKDVDVEAEVRKLLPQLSALSAEERQDAEIRLGLLPPTAFAVVEAVAKDPNVPPAARQQISIYVRQRKPLQEARLRRLKRREADQQTEESIALDAYGRLGKRNAKWDGLVRDALHVYFQTPDASPKLEARQALDAAIEAGCDDPLVVSLAAFSMESTGGNPRQAISLYAEADNDFRSDAYPDYFKVWNSIRYCSLLYRTTSAETHARGDRFIPEADGKIIDRVREDALIRFPGAARTKAAPSQLYAMAKRVLSIYNAAGYDEEPIYRRVAPSLEKALPDRVEPLAFKASFHVDWAWQARGDGLADTVTEKNSKLMQERLKVAEEALKRAYEIDPTDPEAPTLMLTVELGQGKGKDVMETWFKRAMEADPDNITACYHKMYYLEPKWYGSADEVMAFGEECYRGGNYTAKIPMLLIFAHKTVAAYMPDPMAYYRNQPRVWEDVKKVWEPYLRVCPDDAAARNEYCTYAGATGHWDVAREQLQILGDKVNPAYYSDLEAFRKQAESTARKDGK